MKTPSLLVVENQMVARMDQIPVSRAMSGVKLHLVIAFALPLKFARRLLMIINLLVRVALYHLRKPKKFWLGVIIECKQEVGMREAFAI